MKLSFSTRGWADLSWDTWLETALEMKFTGIEVYNLFKFPALTAKGGPLHPHRLAATLRQLRDKKLSIPCLDTSLDLTESRENADILSDMLTYARDLRVPYVVCWASKGDEASEAAAEAITEAMNMAMMNYMPLRGALSFGGGMFTEEMLDGVLAQLNNL